MKKRTIILALLVTIFPMVMGICLWNQLPVKMPVHFDFQGAADAYAPKAFAIFGLPAIMALCLSIVTFFTLKDPKHENIGNKPFQLVLWSVALLSNFVSGGIYAISLNYHFNIAMLTYFAIGLIFILLGNYLPKTKQNYTVGIKVPWTLHSSENWNRTHRFGGYVFILTGFIMMLCGFLQQQILFMICIFAPAILVIVYSYLLYRKGI